MQRTMPDIHIYICGIYKCCQSRQSKAVCCNHVHDKEGVSMKKRHRDIVRSVLHHQLLGRSHMPMYVHGDSWAGIIEAITAVPSLMMCHQVLLGLRPYRTRQGLTLDAPRLPQSNTTRRPALSTYHSSVVLNSKSRPTAVRLMDACTENSRG